MKQLLLYLLIPLLFTTCIKEDFDECFPPYNQDYLFTLYFEYLEKDGIGTFLQKVTNTDVYIYDSQGNYVEAIHLIRTDLTRIQGVILYLPPGDYMAVCWGNVETHNSLTPDTQLSHIDQTFLHFDGQTTADPVYYGPKEALFGEHDYDHYRFTIPENRTDEKTILFTPAYRSIHVYVRGHNTKALQVVCTRLPGEYDFRFGQMTEQHTYQNTTQDIPEEPDLQYVFFDTGMFTDRTPATVTLKHPVTGETLAEQNLQEFIRQNNIDMEDYYDRTIELLFEFDGDTYVEVKLPDWDTPWVTPEF